MRSLIFALVVILCSCSDKKESQKTDTQKTRTSTTKLNKQVSTKAIFENNCVSCHGHDGTAGIAGAANLQISSMSEQVMIQTILNGKGGMPSFKETLSENDIRELALFVKQLKN